ncbi:hypothetical protein EGW08_015045 [Elysia chlorotica]|uniref:BZIP domain-containing protein n=1 Tax=Elysia chlorotica TaxID=188477 RepID=A0A3S0ZWS4_ELYCH|nr:hypothetical protein EGW08_015045 [Elysia chlorotica]
MRAGICQWSKRRTNLPTATMTEDTTVIQTPPLVLRAIQVEDIASSYRMGKKTYNTGRKGAETTRPRVNRGSDSSLESANTRLRRELLSLKERYNLPDSFPFPDVEEEEPREQSFKSGPVQHSASPATPQQQHPHQHHQNHLHQHQPQPQHRLSLDSAPVTPPPQEPVKPRSMSFSTEHHPISRPMLGSPLGTNSSASNNGTSIKSHMRAGGHPPYTSPPPLLAVTGALPVGVGVFPGSAPGLPAFLSEASRLGHHEGGSAGAGTGGNSSLRSSSPLLPHQYPHRYLHRHHVNSSIANNTSGQSHKHHHQQHVTHLPSPSQVLHPHQRDYPVEPFKNEPMEEGEVRARERSNSGLERRPSYHLEQTNEGNAIRRSSLGNYNHYRSTLSPHRHHPYLPQHPAYPGSHASLGRPIGRPAFPPQNRAASYEGFSQSAWASRSPISSHSSDDNYDEPLQLTVRRDSAATSGAITATSTSYDNSITSDDRQFPPHDDSSRDSDSMPARTDSPVNGKAAAPLSSSPPSALPLKMRHKLPQASPEFAYPKDLFPSMASAAVAAAQPSFPHHPHHHPFMNGLAHLSDMAFTQSNPLSLIKGDNSPLPYRQPQRRESRSAAARRTGAVTDVKYLDPKYLERRRRNNEAARKCRENRKTLTKLREAKSDYLESENGKLREELGSLQEEMKQLRELIEKKRLEQGIKDEDLPQHLQQSHIES